MARDPQVEEIRSRIDIVELIGATVNLRKSGQDYKGLCPFHSEDTPSFYVRPGIQRYHCFGCGKTGDVFKFIEEMEHLDFRGALERLAERAGVTLQKRNPKAASEREALFTAMNEAQVFFREQITKSQAARDFLDSRGVSPEMRDAFGVGFAPGFGDALASVLKKRGVRLDLAARAGLVQQSVGGYDDRFKNRVIFPVRDQQGRIIAFGGRALGDVQPKYYNSPETDLFKKSQVLYGFDRARAAIGSEGFALLVEGYLDVIACHSAGLTNAVATLGTSLSEEHSVTLKRWCEKAVVVYDADEAGRKAAIRAAIILGAGGLSVRIARLTPGEDPDTVLKKEGPGALRKLTEEAVAPTTFRLDLMEQEIGTKTPEQREKFVAEAISVIAALPGEVERESYLERVARLLPTYATSISQAIGAVRADIKKRQPKPARSGSAAVRLPTPTAPRIHGADVAEVGLIRAACDTRWSGIAWPLLDAALIHQESLRLLVLRMQEVFPVGPYGGPETVLNMLEDREHEAILTEVLMLHEERELPAAGLERVFEKMTSEKDILGWHASLVARQKKLQRQQIMKQAKDGAQKDQDLQEYVRLRRE